MDHGPQDVREAATLLDEVRRVRRRTSARSPGMWFPMLLFGGLSLLSVPIVLGYGTRVQGVYWMVVGPLGAVVTAVFYARSRRRLGMQVPSGPYLVAIGVIVGGSAVSGMAGGIMREPLVSVAGPPLAVCAGLLLLARLRRAAYLAWVAGVVAVVDVGLLVTGARADTTAVVLSLAYGLPAVLAGLDELRRSRV